MENKFSKREVFVLLDGKIIERYDTLTDFWRRYPVAAISSLSKRIKMAADGWLPDGKKARYADNIDAAGYILDVNKIHPRTTARTIRDEISDDIEQSERKIDELYAMYDAGEITIEERQREVGWLQNHLNVLRNRLKRKLE